MSNGPRSGAGLLPPPARASKRRLYDASILGRIRIILLARDAGFSVRETRTFLNGFPAATAPALRWRQMARQKIAELDQLSQRVAQMKLILNASFHCECRRLEECERLLAAKKCAHDDRSSGAAQESPARAASRARVSRSQLISR